MKGRNILRNLFNDAYKRSKSLLFNPYAKVGLSWLAVRKIKNLPDNSLFTVTLFGKAFGFYHKNEFLYSIREVFIQEVYKQQLKPRPLIIDCGANIGLSVIYLKQLFPDATVIAFEPDDAHFSLLEKNVKAFDLTNVQLNKAAVWVDNTLVNFSNDGSLMSRIETNGDRKKVIQVKSIRLKDWLHQPVDFLKLDIEGAEYAVIKDIAHELNQVKHLFIEYHGTFAQNNELNEILQLVSASGMYFYIKEAADIYPHPLSRKLTTGFDVQLNIFCFRKQPGNP